MDDPSFGYQHILVVFDYGSRDMKLVLWSWLQKTF